MRRASLIGRLAAAFAAVGCLAAAPADSPVNVPEPEGLYAGPPKGYTDLVLDDEFPLSMFFEALEKKMRGVIESTAGIRGTGA